MAFQRHSRSFMTATFLCQVKTLLVSPSPRACRIELYNPSCLTGSVKFTDTMRQRGLESSLRHERGDGHFFLHICFI